MAVKADNINQLINRNAPYVHSNINNFVAIHEQSLLQAKKGQSRLEQTLKNINEIKERLKSQTDTFLEGHTPKQFLKQYYFGGGKDGNEKKRYFEAFLNFFHSPYFYSTINKKMGYLIQEINELFGINIEKTSTDMLSEGYMIKAITDQLIKQIKPEKKGGRIKYEYKMNEQELNKVAQEVLGKNYKKSVTQIKKDIKNKLKNASGGKIDLLTETINLLRSKDCEFFIEKELLKYKIQLDKEQYNFYLNNIILNLSKSLSNRVVTQQSEISGPMGEEFFISVLKGVSGKDWGGIMLTGSWSEEETQKMINRHLNLPEDYKSKTSWHDPKKYSYTDFTIQNSKGQIARVQSKHYEEVLLKFEEGKQNMLQHITLFEGGGSILNFIDRLQNNGQVFSQINSDAIAYVIANSLWFAYAGSINSKGIESKQTIPNREIFSELGAGIGNFLGIIVDDSLQPIQEFSNMFFLINGEVLLPTWVILDELYKMIKKHPIKQAISNFSMNKGLSSGGGFLSKTNLNETASAFKERKRQAVGGVFYSFKGKKARKGEGNYTNPALLNVGKSKGREIIQSTDASAMNMRNLNLNIDYEQAIKSAYNLFK